MILYLCSPYTHADVAVQKRRYEMACRAGARLMAAGIPVIMPLALTLTAMEQGLVLSHSEFLKLDLQLLRRCDEMLLLKLDGWQESVGVVQEIFEGTLRKIPMTSIDEADIEFLPRVKKSAERYFAPQILLRMDED